MNNNPFLVDIHIDHVFLGLVFVFGFLLSAGIAGDKIASLSRRRLTTLYCSFGSALPATAAVYVLAVAAALVHGAALPPQVLPSMVLGFAITFIVVFDFELLSELSRTRE